MKATLYTGEASITMRVHIERHEAVVRVNMTVYTGSAYLDVGAYTAAFEGREDEDECAHGRRLPWSACA